MCAVRAIIDKSQEYFWTKRWQAGESEAEEDIRTGRIREYGSMRQLVSDLASEAGIDPIEKLLPDKLTDVVQI